MNVLIITDMEGLSGVDRESMIMNRQSAGFGFACQRLMLDTNAAIDGAFAGGATRVLVVDGHNSGGNFIESRLDPRAEQVRRFADVYPLMPSVDAFMEIGMHAMAGTLDAFLDHTQNPVSWFNYLVNGCRCGELAQGAIFAGLYDIPFVMVSGDAAACSEARQLLGDIECAVVKSGVGRSHARLVDLDAALGRIRSAARDSLKLINKIQPYRPLLPMEIVLEFCHSDQCDELAVKFPDLVRVDGRTVKKTVAQPRTYADILF